MMNDALAANAAEWHRARRVIAVRLDNLGDVLMTTPALAAIKETLPQSHLTLLASPSGSALAPYLPFINDVIAVRAPWVKHAFPPTDSEVHRTAAVITEGQFDAAVIFTTYTQSALPAALLMMLAGIPLRLAHVRENPYQLLTNWVREREPTIARHEVERQLDLVRTIGITTANDRLRMVLRRADFEAARSRLSQAGIDPESPYLVVHPGASAPSRRYPADRFGAAAGLLAREWPVQIVFTGTADEAHLVNAACQQISDDVVVASLAGELDVGEFAAVIADASILITNNSGPAHIAAAVGTPVIDLYALTNPQHTPWRVQSRVLNFDVPCRNCLSSVCTQGHHLCLNGVTAGEVATAALELLRQTTTARALELA